MATRVRKRKDRASARRASCVAARWTASKIVVNHGSAPVENGAGAASHRPLQLLHPATVWADQPRRPRPNVDGAERDSLAALTTAVRFPDLRAAAIRTGHGWVPGEEKPLVEDPAVSAKPGLRALGAAANRTRTGLGKNPKRRLVRMRRGEPAPSAAACALTLDTAALGTDELSSRDNRRLGSRRELKDPAFTFLDGRLAVPTGPTCDVPVEAVLRELAPATLATGASRTLSPRLSDSRSCHRRGSSRASGHR
jgi:hypothetical protein